MAEHHHLMAGARFQLFTRRAGAVEWRLMSANNWELGRCVSTYDDASLAAEAVKVLRGTVADARRVVAAQPTGGWRWRLFVGDDPVAQSSRAYLRQLECEGVLEQFRRHVPDAPIPMEVRTFR